MRAYNANGWGSYSEINNRGPRVNSLPLKIAAPTINLAEVSNTQVTVRFADALASETGGSDVDIISYELQYASTFGIFNYLATISAGTNQYTHEQYLVGGNEYQYQIRAINYLGASPQFSESVTVWTA